MRCQVEFLISRLFQQLLSHALCLNDVSWDSHIKISTIHAACCVVSCSILPCHDILTYFVPFFYLLKLLTSFDCRKLIFFFLVSYGLVSQFFWGVCFTDEQMFNLSNFAKTQEISRSKCGTLKGQFHEIFDRSFLSMILIHLGLLFICENKKI